LQTGPDEPPIEFRRVSKQFHLQEGNSLKECLPAFVRGSGWSPAFYALNDISFSVQRGETLGIIGRNGSGKSTILKLVAGVMVPTSGEVLARGRVCALLELGAGFHPDLTGRENVFLNASLLGLSNREVKERYDEIVGFAGIPMFMDTPVKRYSSGMYLRLTFAVAVHCDPDILLVDEALAVGDVEFQQKCNEKIAEIQSRGVTILLVSHNLALLEDFCNRALIIDRGRLVAEGPSHQIVRRYMLSDNTLAPVQAASQ
jgi:ABC-2 type transport system ATP-binding protein